MSWLSAHGLNRLQTNIAGSEQSRSVASAARCAFGGLDFPDSAPALAAIAGRETETHLLRLIEALEALRRTLDTNAFEPLALEGGFLKAFG